jgi:hypothetical protein
MILFDCARRTGGSIRLSQLVPNGIVPDNGEMDTSKNETTEATIAAAALIGAPRNSLLEQRDESRSVLLRNG